MKKTTATKTQNEVKHTPGPWSMQGVEIHGANDEIVIGGSYGVNRKNDGPLIAAAPELLEAAKESLFWLTEPRKSSIETKGDMQNALISAIAKAEGK